jgi:hypothetical protein
MKAELAALAGLPRAERRILGRAWISLLLADAALRLSPLPKVQRLLVPRVRPVSAGSTPPVRLMQLVDVAARHHVRPMGCLQKSLVLQSLLHRQGMAVDLRIGVRKHEDTLQAHAWLEQAGQPLFESPEVDSDFPPLLRRENVR